jgi:hypothetical protein
MNIGFYTSYTHDNSTPKILEKIQEEWGSQLENMSYEQKIIMRAALAGYIAEKPVWQTEGSSISCIDCCIESAGVDWNIWDKDEPLVEVIQACSLLSEDDIEELIEALTSQIRGKIYASQIEEWEVVMS